MISNNKDNSIFNTFTEVFYFIIDIFYFFLKVSKFVSEYKSHKQNREIKIYL